MILMLFVAVIALAICVGLVKLGLLYLNSYRLLLRSKCFRGPKALPLIGNILLFTGNTADIYRKIQEIASEYRSPIRLWFGPLLYFCIDDPEQARLILTNPSAIEKSEFYDVIKPLTGDGLLTASVSKWKPHRKAIQPLFSRNFLESLIQIFESKALTVTETIGMEGEETEIDIHHYLSLYAIESICETALGSSVSVSSGKDLSFLDMVTSALPILPFRVTRPWLYPDFIFKLSSMGQRFYKCIKDIHNFIRKTVADEKRAMQKELTTQPRKSLLGLLLTASEVGYKFTDEEVLDEVTTIIGAGYETTTTVTSMAIFILARYPDIQDKVYAEVSEICGMNKSKGLDITMQDLDRMEYLGRVLKETMRFFPIASLLSRSISEDINIGEYTLPMGSSVIINLTSLHRKEKYWPKPLEFIPDRFLPMHPLGPQHSSAYMPFSAGARNCIGGKYATISMKILLATLVSKYIIKTTISQEAKDIGFDLSIVLRPTHPITISIQRRFPEVC